MTDFSSIREQSIRITKDKIRESVNEDDYIIKAINNIEELAKQTNSLTKRMRDWYNLYLPEFSKLASDNEGFVNQAIEKDRNQLMKEMKLDLSMGKDLETEHLEPILQLGNTIKEMFQLREKLKKYLDKIVESHCKNMYTITGYLLGAKLIESAGSLKRLAMMPASTIQMLGAEKALFRHLKTGAKPPKHGIILQHPLVSGSKRQDRGKSARMFADKISLAAKTDYFKGEFIGDKLKEELEAKLK
jgi:nucleolar protein 56